MAGMATPPIPWDKIIQYGPAVADMATKAWARAARWRQEKKPAGPAAGDNGAETLGEAMADQATLSREIAEQLKGVTAAVGELSTRLAALEAAQAQHEREATERHARLWRRTNLALVLAASALLACAILAAWLIAAWRVA